MTRRNRDPTNSNICRSNKCGHYDATTDACTLVIAIGIAKGEIRKGKVRWLDSNPQGTCPNNPPLFVGKE